MSIQKGGQATSMVTIIISMKKNTYSSVSENTDTYSRASQLMNKEKLPI